MRVLLESVRFISSAIKEDFEEAGAG